MPPLLLLLVCHAAAQDLPPELLLLSRIKRHVREELAHLPNYTCLETVARFQKDASRRLAPLDTVRLEIVYSDHKEWYGSPGAKTLTVENPVNFIGSGMIGNGAFATSLNNVFEGATFKYQGEELLSDRKTVKYSFHLPRLLQGFSIKIQGGSGTVGEDGVFWADRESLDVVRVALHAVEIPPYLPLAESSMQVDYARTKIGGYNGLLAQQADLHMLETNGVESYDRLDFTHCRAFSAESVLRFEATEPGAPAAAAAEAIASVPGLLAVNTQLATPVTDKSIVGELIEGRVNGNVLRKGKLIIPDGSLIHGRVRRLEHYRGEGPERYIVGLEFTDVETSAGPMRFYADLMQIDRSTSIRVSLAEKVFVPNGRTGFEARDSTVTLPELPGIASFFVTGATFALPKDFRMTWRTRASATPSK